MLRLIVGVHYALSINNRVQIEEITPVDSSTDSGIQSNILAFQ